MGVAYDNGKGEVFVTNFNSDNVSVINDTTDNVVSTIGVGTQPEGAAYDHGKAEVFVANIFPPNCYIGCAQGTVSVISDESNTVVANVTVGYTPMGVAYDGGKGEVFVANSEANLFCYNSVGTVSVIADETNAVAATVNVGKCPYGLAYDGGKGEVFVANAGSDSVSVINDTTDTLVATVSVGASPYGVAYDSERGDVFVSDGDNVSVISDVTDALVANISVGATPEGLAYDSEKGEVFVTNSGSDNVSVINDTSDTVVGTVPVGSYPDGAAYDAAKGEVFVTNEFSDDVSVVLAVSEYTATFMESGLPPAALWYVNVTPGPSSGLIYGSTTTYSVDLQNGSYTFSAGTTDTSYRAIVGSFKVHGAPVSQSVIFSSISKAATFLGLPQAEGYAVVAGVVAAAIIGVAVIVLSRRRVKSGAPRSASCRQCGSELRTDVTFCPSCGRPVR